MDLLEQRIANEGTVLPPDILKVDGFLNHRLDVALIDSLGAELARLFKDDGANLILTVEASGIALACAAARHLGIADVVFAKKGTHKNVGADVYTAQSYSFTHGAPYTMQVARRFITDAHRVLIVDDFLADGKAVNALISITQQAGASVAGIGIGIEKGFQPGGRDLRAAGYKLRSLAIVESMQDGKIVFGGNDR